MSFYDANTGRGYPRTEFFTFWQKIALWVCLKLSMAQMADVYSVYLKRRRSPHGK